MIRGTSLALLLALLVAACGGGEDDGSAGSVLSPDMCAHVVKVEVAVEAGGTYRFDVTVRSSETGWEKYADAWEIRAPDGSVLGTRVLAHPHVDEQPFTRSLTGVLIPEGIDDVEVAAHDLVEGFCGETMQITVPGT